MDRNAKPRFANEGRGRNVFTVPVQDGKHALGAVTDVEKFIKVFGKGRTEYLTGEPKQVGASYAHTVDLNRLKDASPVVDEAQFTMTIKDINRAARTVAFDLNISRRFNRCGVNEINIEGPRWKSNTNVDREVVVEIGEDMNGGPVARLRMDGPNLTNAATACDAASYLGCFLWNLPFSIPAIPLCPCLLCGFEVDFKQKKRQLMHRLTLFFEKYPEPLEQSVLEGMRGLLQQMGGAQGAPGPIAAVVVEESEAKVKRIGELFRLYSEGALSKEEFEKLKQEVIVEGKS